MKTVQYAIVSEEMVWLWFYDELNGKHIKELWGRDAREFVKEHAQISAAKPAPKEEISDSGTKFLNESVISDQPQS